MKVRIKEDINLKDLAENNWNGCRYWTMDFLKKFYGDNETFEAEATYDDDYKIYSTSIGNDNYIVVNHKCLEEIPVKEMTIAEISEALGYEVKIIKEDSK